MSVLSSQHFSTDLAILYGLELLFYLGYAFFFKYLVRNEKDSGENSLIILLILCDFGGNTVEYLVRFLVLPKGCPYLKRTLCTIFYRHFIRSAMIWLVYEFLVSPRQSASGA